jgi:hypothetical protein
MDIGTPEAYDSITSLMESYKPTYDTCNYYINGNKYDKIYHVVRTDSVYNETFEKYFPIFIELDTTTRIWQNGLGQGSILDGNLNTRFESDRNDPTTDTLRLVFDIRKQIYADSIKFYFEYRTSFDMFVSDDSTNWILITADTIPEL